MRTRRALLPALATAVVVAAGLASPLSAAAATPDTPVPDVDYVYNQLYTMSTQYLQRYSGLDGPPGDLNPADGNLPPQINGWQEFFQHWHEQMTSPAVMGAFAPDIHYDDHLFRAPGATLIGGTPPYDSNVASVTIPGSSCPGQPVLVASHPDSTAGLNIANGSSYDDTSGVTMGMGELQALTRWWTAHHTWPSRTIRVALFDAEESGLYGSAYYASSLIPPGPQGYPILVANMDQNGIEYPSHPFGTTKSTWGPGFWYTNINASPISDFSQYPGAAKQAILANIGAVTHFRQALDASVRQAFATQGAKYNFSVPLENALEAGATVPAYLPADVNTYSPVQDDTLGRTDQVPFVALGIPGFGVVGAFDSNAQDNPISYPDTPLSQLGAIGIPQLAGYDTPRDNMQHFNLITSGTTGGTDSSTGAVELRRGLELPMTWTLNLLSRPEYAGADAGPPGPVSYFEALPTAPSAGQAVTFNGAETAIGGGTAPLTYAWDFGDGTHATGVAPAHAYARDGWYDAKLAVTDAAGHTSGYHQSVKVGKAAGSAPTLDACGRLSVQQTSVVVTTAGGSSSPNTGAVGAASVVAPTVVAIVVLPVARRVRGRRRGLGSALRTRTASPPPARDPLLG